MVNIQIGSEWHNCEKLPHILSQQKKLKLPEWFVWYVQRSWHRALMGVHTLCPPAATTPTAVTTATAKIAATPRVAATPTAVDTDTAAYTASMSMFRPGAALGAGVQPGWLPVAAARVAVFTYPHHSSCSAVQCSALPLSAVLYRAVKYFRVQFNTTQGSTVLTHVCLPPPSSCMHNLPSSFLISQFAYNIHITNLPPSPLPPPACPLPPKPLTIWPTPRSPPKHWFCPVISLSPLPSSLLSRRLFPVVSSRHEFLPPPMNANLIWGHKKAPWRPAGGGGI